MNASWDPDALWMKAKLFINNALDPDEVRPFDEQALWASLSLELLAKAALSRASPVLIAAPDEDGRNLLAAAGLVRGATSFRSVKAHTLFKRCALAFRPFNADEAGKLAQNRNDYLHSGTPSFAPIPPEAWWPRFWAQADILVEACGKDMDAFVGEAHAPQVRRLLQQNTQTLRDRVQALIERARRDLARYEDKTMSGREITEWERPRDRSAGLSHDVLADCPACDFDDALLEGDEVIEEEVVWEQYSESDFDAHLVLTIEASHFSCSRCHLVLDSPTQVELAGLDDRFDAEGDLSDEWIEPDYGND